jgi:ribosomal protein L4
MFKISGKIGRISETQVISEKFQKREFVILTNDQYPQSVQLELTQERVNLLENYNVGSEVEAMFNINGREWKNPQTGEIKYFNTLQAFAIHSVNKTQEQKTNLQTKDEHWSGLKGDIAQDHVDQGLNNMLAADDDLPF